MPAQSRFSVSGGGSSGSLVSADEHEAVIRELTRGHELTAQLRAEALRALRGNGEAEATAAGILQEVSRAFAFCLSIMSSPARVPPTPPGMPEKGSRTVVGRDESVPRRQVFTYSPHSDGYQWRKYGQKRITNTIFPRCYYRCSYFRERGCPATKLVQKHRHGDPPEYVVIYVKEHTCNTEPVASPAAANSNPLLMMDQLARQQVPGGGLQFQEERERQALVSSLACVLGAAQSSSPPPPAAAFGREEQPSRTCDASAAPASASVVDQMQANGNGGEQVDAGLDVMDYDVTGALYFGDSYALPDDSLPF